MTNPVGRPGVVFDCNVIVQAIANQAGPAGRSLAYLEAGWIETYVSRSILRELRRVLMYPRVRAILSHMTEEVIERFVQRLVFRAVVLRRVRHLMDYPRAPQDEPYLDAAWTVQADFIVTCDNDLLTLADDHTPWAKRVRRQCPRLEILKPVAFLERVPASSN